MIFLGAVSISRIKLCLVAFAILIAGGTMVAAQWPQTTLARVKQIKLLTSDRDDVKRAFAEYEASDDEGHIQDFDNDGVSVTVSYAFGGCGATEDDADSAQVWDVPEWKVTKIAISFDDDVPLNEIGTDRSNFDKEFRSKEDQDSFTLVSKKVGVAINVNDSGVGRIVFFPSQDQSKKLCSYRTREKQFYSAKGKYMLSPYDNAEVDINEPANVTDLDLDRTEVSGSTGTKVSVTTVAMDPENDVLTYNYTVAAGKILGTGAKVVWDLAGVPSGSYTITAAVDDGCGVCGKTKTRTVVVKF